MSDVVYKMCNKTKKGFVGFEILLAANMTKAALQLGTTIEAVGFFAKFGVGHGGCFERRKILQKAAQPWWIN